MDENLNRVSESRFSDYLRGKAEPTLKIARNTAQKLNIELAIILGVSLEYCSLEVSIQLRTQCVRNHGPIKAVGIFDCHLYQSHKINVLCDW